ncbi:unnamed protein product [Rhizoctonia solani]|uniref:Uncharacterized protein n=2 Tax=Rhizoctonia solani TaxID=456999 RepID=A0A8H3HJG3_9AGAM|nr:unnamed protein product [Rhizoctonia solani]
MWGFGAIVTLVAAASGLVAALPTSNTTLPIIIKRSINGIMWGFGAIVTLVAAASGLVAALPTSNTTLPIIIKRSINGATGSNCNGYTFTAAQVSAAAQESLNHVLAGTTVGTNKYPHVLDNREGFTYPSGCTVTRYEFPIFKNKIYTGGDPSVDRVIIGHVSGSSAYSCGVLTHQGASGNNFLQCDNV